MLYSHDFAVCPWCGGHSGSRVDHLYDDHLPREAGPWYCGLCKMPYRVLVNAPGDVVLSKDEDNKKRHTRSMALLKFEGKDGPVFFVMDHDRYRGGTGQDETDEANQDHQRYFFEEQSCPTNWLRECVAVIEDGDCDPHGFLDFVRAVDVPQDFDEDNDANWVALFPEAFEGKIIEGELAVRKITKSN